MILSTVVFRGTLGVKSAMIQISMFRNLLQKPIFRRCISFHGCNVSSGFFSSPTRRMISVSRCKNAEKFCQDPKAILNNVIVFKYERSKAYAFIVGFALIQLMGMLTMASNVYNTFCKDLFDPSKSWSTRIVEHKFSLFAIGCGIVFGPIIAILAFAICCRTVRRIILHKGGNAVTIVTYHPIPSMTTFTVPLESVSCRVSRMRRGSLPLKIKGKSFFYVIDSDGEFLNSDLFDLTVGVQRK